MWDFIKYCLYCLGLAILGSMGNNPEGLTFTTGLVGILTFFALIGIGCGLLYVISLFLKPKN